MSDREKCLIRGYLYGVICEEFAIFDPALDTQVVAVSARGVAPSGAAGEKVVVRDATADEMAEAIRVTVAEGTVSAKGTFCLEGTYDGGPVDVYVEIDRVPFPGHEPGYKQLPESVRLYLGEHVPVRVGDEYLLNLLIPNRVWCRLKKRCDVWTIAGRVRTCDERKVPIGGVTVSAFDTDLVQDDPLGSAITSSSGRFRIDYPGSAYRQGTWIDVELFGGPDVYFKITDADGNVLPPIEDRSAGRAKGRADRGPCACFELCVDIRGDGVGPIPSVWTSVGTAFTIPDGSTLNDFDAEGYAGAARYGLTSTIRMTGSAPLRTAAGNSVEYRFRVSDATAANGGPLLPGASFTRIVGVSPNHNLFAETRVGQMVRFTPFKIIDIDAQLVDLDADGWLDVNRSIQRTFSTHPDVTLADLPDFAYIDLDGLMAINTAELTSATDPPSGPPGAPVAPGDRIPVEKMAVRFEVRERTSATTTVDLPGNGTTVNSMVINNNPTYLRLAMTEHLSGTPCGILSGSIHAAYTVHHPHLRSVHLQVTSNNGTYNLSLNDPEPPGPTVPPNFQLPMAGNTSELLVHKNNAALAVPNAAPNKLHTCTYLVTLNALRRLHTGDNGVGWESAWTTFFYQL